MRDYLEYVHAIENAVIEAREIPAPEVHKAAVAAISAAAPVLMISPHPDDEMIIGALPLRLSRQCFRRVINLSATLGSRRDRQVARLEELRAACDYIGFEARTIGERGLEGINPEAPSKDPAQWALAVDAVAAVIDEVRPCAVFIPHAMDGNRTHMGVHLLAVDALARAGITCAVFETEFWAAMDKPNIAVESSSADVAALVAALSLHTGEVRRNPYHLRLPAWMMDNVRRGAELVGGQGGDAPRFLFACLYRRVSCVKGRLDYFAGQGSFLPCGQSPEYLLIIGK
jgi:N-acetylglucosamine malate deacetylase 1